MAELQLNVLGLNVLGGGGDSEPAPLSAPVNNTLPTISGTPLVGETLTANPGGWSGNPAPSFSYDWRRDNVSIGADDQNTYLTVAADDGAAVKCTVTGTNSQGSSSADSNELNIGAGAAIETWVLPGYGVWIDSGNSEEYQAPGYGTVKEG